MPFCCCFVKLPATELALCPVVILLNLLLRWFPSLLSWLFLGPWSRSHCSSEHFTLSFPFGSLTSCPLDGLIINTWSLLLSQRLCLWWRLFIRVIILIIIDNLSLLLHIKLLSFIHKHLQTDLLVLLHCFFIELSWASWTLYSIVIWTKGLRLAILFAGCFINVLLLLLWLLFTA